MSAIEENKHIQATGNCLYFTLGNNDLQPYVTNDNTNIDYSGITGITGELFKIHVSEKFRHTIFFFSDTND